MSDSMYIDFLTTLLEETRNGKVKWSETTDESQFRVALGGGVVRVGQQWDPNTETLDHSVHLHNRRGRELHRLWDYEDASHADLVHHLFDAARASALEIDKLLKRMIDAMHQGALDSLPPEEDGPNMAEEEIPF